MGRDNDHTGFHRRGAIGHRRARGDVSGESHGQETFPTAMIPIEQRHSCQRETVLPEPANGSGNGLNEMALVDGEGVNVRSRETGRSWCFLAHNIITATSL